ncbi:GntR family transcriptional regulator [Shouchella patagoniensis]|uniref:GntR family transcriptional regulator n=1 Tax=Shouchella patagoniensis TaxID=228576 RepID=UPI000995200F|nr:GntR family transcriptional regulator [Shouchella patagoniensis]
MDVPQKDQSLHAQVKDEIIKRIESGEYPVQSQLPTEAEFCEKFNVSRTTVRQALQQLSQEGFVYRRQGRGTFVAEPKIRTSLSQTVISFNEQLALQGKQPDIQILSLNLIPANHTIASSLKRDTNDPIHKLVRMRYGDGKPLQYEIAYIPWAIAPGLTQEQCKVSLYGALRKEYDIHIARTEEHLQLTFADENISKLLQIEEHTPCFYLETSAFLENGVVAEYSQTYFHGERASFVIERVYN